jgi:hypothetical protein
MKQIQLMAIFMRIANAYNREVRFAKPHQLSINQTQANF